MKRFARLSVNASSLATVLWPAAGWACSVCGEGTGRNHTAFFLSTIGLSLLPLAMLGGGVFWLARNAREFLAAEFTESDELPPAPASRVQP